MPLPNTLKALLIDFDGTLADTTPFLYKAYESLLNKRGLTPSKEEFSHLSGPSIQEGSSFLQRKYGLKETPEALYREWKSHLLPLYQKEVHCVEGGEALINMAQGKWKLALVSSAEKGFIAPFLEKYQFPFDLVISREEIHFSKPHPEPYLLALKKLKIDSFEAIAIEDSIPGVISATQAGIYTLLITHNDPFLENSQNVNTLLHAVTLLKKTYG